MLPAKTKWFKLNDALIKDEGDNDKSVNESRLRVSPQKELRVQFLRLVYDMYQNASSLLLLKRFYEFSGGF